MYVTAYIRTRFHIKFMKQKGIKNLSLLQNISKIKSYKKKSKTKKKRKIKHSFSYTPMFFFA